MGFLNRPNSKFSTTLSASVNDTTSTSFSLNALPGRYPCVLLVDPGTSSQEKVQVTGEGTGTVTVVRNYDGAGAHTHSLGATVVDYDSPEYIIDIVTLLEANFNSDNTPGGTLLGSSFANSLGNFIVSGLTIPVPSSSLTGTVALGIAYYAGVKYSVASDGGHAYTASKDTYVDINPSTGGFTYSQVSNGAAAPAIAANSIRIALVVTNGSQIISTQQAGVDSLGNLIYPTKPSPTLSDIQQYRSQLADFVVSGLTAPTSASLSTTIALGTVYFKGLLYSIASDGGHAYTASKDTYVDLDPETGAFTYTPVNNGAAAPALTTRTIRIAKVVSGASTISSVAQDGSYDSLQNIIYPNDPRGLLTNYYTPSAGGTVTLSFAGNIRRHVIQMPAGNITIALPTGYIPQYFEIEIIQDGSGSRTVTWFSTIDWKAATAPTLSTGGNAKDIFGFLNRISGTFDGYTIDTNH